MSPVKQTVVMHSCFIYLAYLVVISAIILSSEGIPTKREAKRSNRSVTACVADSAVRLVRCGYTDGCIWAEFRCDDVIDCDDGSDESEATCRGGSACDESQAPACPSHSTCRSISASEIRLAHHVCDCVTPFTGANCTEMRTTTVQQAVTEATKKQGEYSSILATESTSSTMTSESQAFTTQGTTSDTHSADSSTSATKSQNTTPSDFTTGFDTTHSPGVSTVAIEKTSSPIAEDMTVATQSTTATITDQEVNNPGSLTTRHQSDPTTDFVTPNDATNTGDANTSNTATVSTASGTSSEFPSTESTQRSTVDKVPPTGVGATDNPTEPVPRQSTVIPTPGTTAAIDGHGHATQTVDSSSTPHPKRPPNNGSNDSRNQNPGTTPILVVVFGLITLIPMAIFFHCRVKRKGFKMLTSKAKKEDDKVESGDTQENSKPNHQRNSSISSIKLKENSTLLGNELPLDVNMNRPAPIPPAIVVTPPPDVTTESSLETQRAKKKKRHRKQQQTLPDTQFWFPDDGETPYFVTDNDPLPVSLV
ncbi:uncharacterized protein PB18E9.04c-like [Patiria miniata]|uniref:EGF-like domain-containing protein n=1 Tax=Patiria miniata TaxID=46514 RepID=A0A913Z4W3_PATMI|nr:uncharacterized protein PB18E9.04c-like [Patiria miniata]